MEYDLEKQGFCILRSAIDESSLKIYQKEIETFSNKQNVENVQSLVKHNLLWDYISNKKIINKIENVLGNKILFLNDAGLVTIKIIVIIYRRIQIEFLGIEILTVQVL